MSNVEDENDAVSTTTTTSQSTNSVDRRKTLKKLGIGGALVTGASWTTPLVQSIVLPAHAQSSPTVTPIISDEYCILLDGPTIIFAFTSDGTLTITDEDVGANVGSVPAGGGAFSGSFSAYGRTISATGTYTPGSNALTVMLNDEGNISSVTGSRC